MDEISKSVAENIKNGDYFRDARRWYTHKYLYPIVERSFLLLFTSITTIVFICIVFNFKALFPLKNEVPFVVKVEDSLDYYSVIKPLARGAEPTQEVIAKYLLEQYVKVYESYSFKTVDENDIRVKAASSKQVYKSFVNFMSTNNPESPLLIYQKTTSRTVKIISVELSDTDEATSTGVVTFDAILEDRLNKTKTINRYKAFITFSISNIKDLIVKKDSLEFIVTDYQVRQIR